MANLGTLYVAIVPTTKGISGQIYKEMAPEVTKATEKVGRLAGQSLSQEISGALGGLSSSTRTLGSDLAKAMAPAVSAVSRFTDGFRSAEAAASSFTGKMGTAGGAARKVAENALTMGNNFRAGFSDAKAAASSFTGYVGTVGGAVRKVADAAVLPGKNLVAGFNDAKAAGSSFTGTMGTIGGMVRKVADTAALPGRNLVSGFRDASAASSSLTGTLGTIGGAVRRVSDSAVAVGRSAVGMSRTVAAGVSSAMSGVTTVVGGVRSSFSTFGSSVSQAFAPISERVQTVGSQIAGLGGAAVTAGTTVVGAIGAIAAAGGFNRAVQIEQAQAKLIGLGNSTQDVEKIMENANAAVKGTSAALNESATVAAAAVASGVAPGEDLERVLRTINDTAGIAGISMQDAGTIFNSVLARGKLQGDDLLQLSSRGVPVLKFLSDQLGVTTQDVSKMVEKGQIDFDTFESAMRAGVGGSAVAMGKTTSGALSNLSTAISRFGANVITPFMPIIQNLALGLTDAFDNLGKVVKPVAATVAGALVAMVQPGSLVATAFQVISDKAASFRDTVAGVVGAIPAPALAGIAGAAGLLAAKLGAIVSSGIGSLISSVLGKLPIIGGALAQVTSGAGILTRALTFLSGPVGLIITIVGAAIASSSELQGTLGALATTVMGLVAQVAGQLAPVFTMIAQTVLPLLVGLFQLVVQTVAQLLVAILPLVSTLLTQLVPVIVQLITTLLPPLVQIFGLVVQVVGALLTAIMPLITTLLSLLIPVLQFVVTVVAALASGILTLIGAAITWLTTVAVPAMGLALQAIGAFFSWLWTGVVQPVWTWIQGAISNVITWITTIVVPWVQAAMAALGLAFSWLYVNVVQPIWNGIKVFIAAVVAVILTIWQGLTWFVQNVLGPVWNWLYVNAIQPAWTAIRNVISAAWSWIRDAVLTPLMNFVRGPLTAAWNWIRNVVAQVWGAIRTAVSSAWSWVRDAVLTPLINFVRGPLTSAWTWLRSIVSQVWGAIRGAVSSAWSWVRDAVLTPLINFLRGALTSAWRWVSTIVAQVWSGISRSVSSTWNFVRGSILQPMINFLRTNVVNAWNAAKDGISRAWNAVKSIVDKPVDFVINTVINGGFIKNFNKVASKFGIGTIDEIHYKGLARGGVVPGYQRRKVDDHLAPVAGGGVQPLRGGEGILVPEATRALGPSWIHGMNAAANNGGVSGAQSWLDDHKPSIETFPKDNDKRFAVGPPGGPSGGLWSSNQARASQLGYFMVPRGSLAGVSFESAARAWMGRSALDIRMGSGGPGVQSISGGGGGPWGYATSDGRITITPGGPSAVGKDAVRGTIAHEIGHVLSLNHPPGGYGATGSIMSAGMNGGYWPSSTDYAKLAEIYGEPGKGVKKYDDPGGGGGGGILSGLLDLIGFDKLLEKIPGAGFAKDLMVGAAKHTWEAFKSWAASVINPFDGGDSEVASGQSAESWRDTVIEALKKAGLPATKPYQDAWVKQIDTESGGDPNAVQGAIGDVNNATGDLGKGLVQVIGSTFAASRDPSLPNNQFDPLANLVAGMRYAKGKFGVEGMLGAIGKGHGYALGGILPENLTSHIFDGGGWLRKTTDPMLVHHRESKPDAVLTNGQFADFHALAESVRTDGARGPMENHFHFEGTADDPDHIGRRASEALAFELMRAGV
ncbi:tape measure protein [Kocuria sp.]|uniref:tape measure protein n=1 Tax=Kocuria sp. TaxID=1871328 RepID=UPI0026DAC0F4|nr:tape measure protein [Kocuria sp.]MDO4920099.1 tape measure protein [Kocuria sp.]